MTKHALFSLLLLVLYPIPAQAQSPAVPDRQFLDAPPDAAPEAPAAGSGDAARDTSSEALHLWAGELDAEPGLIRLRGDGRLFAGSWRLLAEQLQLAPEADLILAQGQVSLAAPAFDLLAETLELRPGTGYVLAHGLSLRHRGMTLRAARADLSAGVWRFAQAELSFDDSPLVLRAAAIRLLPAARQETLVLEQVSLPGLPFALPVLSLNLPELSPDTAEVRAPVSVFQPELGLVSGGLRAGISSELWRDSEQRLYGRLLADPISGGLAELAHEWRPNPGLLLHSQLGLGSAGLSAGGEALWQIPIGLWLRGRARYNQPDSFAREFWLPPLQPGNGLASGLELWAASDWINWQGLRSRVLTGARWPQQHIGLTWLAQLPLYESDVWQLHASSLANGLWAGGPEGTLGARLLAQSQPFETLEIGGYLEAYASSLPAGLFLQPERLSPWLGGFMFWRLREDLGLGLEAALSLSSGRPVLADALLSWRLRPFYLHLLLQGIPAGVQIQTRFEL